MKLVLYCTLLSVAHTTAPDMQAITAALTDLDSMFDAEITDDDDAQILHGDLDRESAIGSVAPQEDTEESGFGSFSYSSLGIELGGQGSMATEQPDTPRHVRPCFSSCADMPDINADETAWCSFVAPLTHSSACLSACEDLDFIILDDFQSVCPSPTASFSSFDSFGNFDSFGSFDAVATAEVPSQLFMKMESGASATSQLKSQSPAQSPVLAIGAAVVCAIAALAALFATMKMRSTQQTPNGLMSPVSPMYRVEQEGEIYL
jgi:hypothetical protein